MDTNTTHQCPLCTPANGSTRDPTRPPRGLSEYMIFANEYRERVKQRFPDLTFGSIIFPPIFCLSAVLYTHHLINPLFYSCQPLMRSFSSGSLAPFCPAYASFSSPITQSQQRIRHFTILVFRSSCIIEKLHLLIKKPVRRFGGSETHTNLERRDNAGGESRLSCPSCGGAAAV